VPKFIRLLEWWTTWAHHRKREQVEYHQGQQPLRRAVAQIKNPELVKPQVQANDKNVEAQFDSDVHRQLRH
jgi:hypothetical protein